ncbi:hypothetical protein FZEAL_6632 [Fusarium zealandicum]|uniref:Uncharacterized protein n=1 Tax=Fusarium zealandicum TaxID=1053134 RepID=A0A8H4UI79_9HYPO|nr:hypothetical protein FZEAL_6632 [Fusarium zealandicum]
MNLQDLQPELILQICENLCQHCLEKHSNLPRYEIWDRNPEASPCRQALVSLSLVSKRVGAIAQTVLYHHFGFLEQSPLAPFYFCRTISENPNLARKIRLLYTTHVPEMPDIEEARNWLPGVLDKFKKQLDFPPLPQGVENIFDNTYPSSRYLIPALILFQVPRLEHIYVAGRGNWAMFNMIDRKAMLIGDFLPKGVKSLGVGALGLHDTGTEWKKSLDISEKGAGRFLAAFNRLSALCLHSPTGSITIARPSLDNVRTLRLSESALTIEQLRDLIQTTKCLEEFAYQQAIYNSSDTQAAISSQAILEVLADRKETLRRVILYVGWRNDPVVSAKCLTGLEELKVNGDALRNMLQLLQNHEDLKHDALIDVFPPSIHTLHLDIACRSFRYMQEAIASYIESTYRSSPVEQKLKRVVIHYRHLETLRHNGPTQRVTEELIEVFRAFFQNRCQRWLRNGTLEIYVPFTVSRFKRWYLMDE